VTSLSLGRWVLQNKSLGLNYHFRENICFHENETLSFRPNRHWNQTSYTVLLEFFAFYPPDAMNRYFAEFVSRLKRLSPWLLAAWEVVVPCLVAVDYDLLPRFHAHPNFTFVDCTRDVRCSKLVGLDRTYSLFLYGSKQLPVLYAYLTQTDCTISWLAGRYRIAGGGAFGGYYAHSFALIISLPYRIRLFDFFDFFVRFDFDIYVPDCPFQTSLFATQEMVSRSMFASGCGHGRDAWWVSQNVFKMTDLYMDNLGKSCGRKFRIPSRENGWLTHESQAIPGRFQEMWLGLYSSPEVGLFSMAWYDFPGGWRKYRWGDQQYYFLVNALYSRNARLTLRSAPGDLVCTWGHKTTKSRCPQAP
jgi:hypothetical protein